MGWWCVVVGVLAGVVPCAVGAASVRSPQAHILVDASSGEVLAEERADAAYPPGALANLMLLLLSLEQASLGTLPLDVPVVAGSAATRGEADSPAERSMPRVPLRADRSYILSDLLRATMVTSSDETALAVAEVIAGSASECLWSMNARARRLGMASTSFARIGGARSGSKVEDRTTARDVARLARSLLRHPEALGWASLSGMPFEDGAFALRNVNELLGVVRGVDGLHVSSRPGEGFSIVATAERAGLRLVAVVLGADTSAVRYSTAAQLIEWGFARYERVEVARKGEPLNVALPVRGGSVSHITPVLGEEVSLLRRNGEVQDLQLRYQLPPRVDAPVEPGRAIGELVVERGGILVNVVPVLTPLTAGRHEAGAAAADDGPIDQDD